MANSKISALTSATTPLAGSETLPVVQSGVTKQVSVANLTAGRAVSMSSATVTGLTASKPVFTDGSSNLTSSGTVPTNQGGTGLTSFTANSVLYASSTSVLATGSGLTYDGTTLTSTGTNANLQAYATTGTVRSIIRTNTRYWDFTSDSTNSGALRLNDETNGTTNMTWDSAGNMTFHISNIIQGTAAKGINFTANTGAAGMTSQLLNWYEEGTWTPTVTAASGTITATNQGSRYTRIGKMVIAYGYLNIGSVSSPSGTMTIGGLPFTNGAQYAACLLTLFGGSFTQSVGGYVDASTTNIIATNFNANAAAAGGNIMVSASYMVA